MQVYVLYEDFDELGTWHTVMHGVYDSLEVANKAKIRMMKVITDEHSAFYVQSINVQKDEDVIKDGQ